MKILKRALWAILFLVLLYGVSYAWRALPILSGYGAKDLCSCVMVASRQPEDVIKNELGRFPLSLGSYRVDLRDSSATGSVWGLARRKAVFRKGLGCTLLSEISEDNLRQQSFRLASPVFVPDTVSWPAGDRVDTARLAGVNYAALSKAIDFAFAEPGEKKLRRTRTILVVYDGHIIAERYAEGFSVRSRQIGWSMTKSVTNALIGILVRQGKLKVNDPAPIEHWKNDDRRRITLNDLMHQSSGLAWEENYAGPSGATNMLFKKKDMGVYAAQSPLQVEPGKFFYYSSGTSNILSRIIRETVRDQEYYEFPYRELFHKIGMASMVIEPDAGGTFVGSSYSFATARDWARFGLLYLNDGVWKGTRLLPEGWVTYSSTPAPAAPRGEYGAQFWLNAGAAGNPADRNLPDVPPDLFMADGFEGQNVWIVPSKKLVVVRLSLQQGNPLNENKFLSMVINALP
jgi:CubicO group peptidase (beta-lactamase class C family)